MLAAEWCCQLVHTCQQQLVVDRDLAQLAQQLAVEVLQAVTLIDDDILPGVPLQQLTVCYDDLIGSHNHRKLLTCCTCSHHNSNHERHAVELGLAEGLAEYCHPLK